MRVALLLLLTLALLTIPAAFAEDFPLGELAGAVTDDAGQPIEGALVDCWTWHAGNETKTDKQGHFHLKNLQKDGPVEIRISKPGLSPWYEVNQPTGVDDLKVTLNAKTFFEGTVFAPDGKPMPSALVRADAGPKKNQQVEITHVWTETRADANGHYKLFVAPDQYALEVYDPKVGVAHLRVTANADEGVAQDVHLDEGSRLVIKCLDDADQQPIPGVHVHVNDHKGMDATSDAQGQAVFKHLPPEDKLELNFESKTHMRWYSPDAAKPHQHELKTNNSWSYFGIDVIPVAHADAPVTIYFEKGVTLSGRVVDPHDQPVPGAIVITNLPGFADTIDQTQRFTAHTKADGSFSLVVPASDDPVNLVAHDGDYGKTRHWANGVSEAFDAPAGASHADITIHLTPPATIKGKVLTRNGDPAAGKWVRVIGADDRDGRYTAPNTHADADGNFELPFVRPGDVVVQVEPFYMKNRQGRTPPITSVPVTVDPGETKEGVQLTAPR